MKKSLKLLTLLFSSSLILAGCKDFEPNWPMESPNVADMVIDTNWEDYIVPCKTITLGKGESNININKGETHQFIYDVEPRDANIASLTWKSENPEIATVENGVLTALAGGKTTITVSCGEVTAKSKVNVIVPIEDFEVKNKSLVMDIEDEVQLEVELTPSDTTQNKIKYELVEGDSVSVSDDGLVKALKKSGDAQIKVTNEVLNKVETVNINVSDRWNYVDKLSISLKDNTSNKVEVTKTGKLVCDVVGMDENVPASTLKNNAVSFVEKKANETDPSYLELNSETGEFTVLDVPTNGKVTVEASLIDERCSEDNKLKTQEFTFDIFEVHAVGITLSTHDTIELNNKDEDKATKQLSYSYVIEDAYKDSYTVPSRGRAAYSTDDKNVASVTEDGLVSFVGASVDEHGHAKFDTKIRITDPAYKVFDSIKNEYVAISDEVTVQNSIYASSITLTGGSTFYLDEVTTLTASVTPTYVTEDVVWEVEPAINGHEVVEDGNKIKITCKNLTEEIKVTAKIGTNLQDSVTLTPAERPVDFENGKVYIVGSSNYKGGVSKDTADGKGSWGAAKYAFVMTDKTGNTNAKYEYKATIEFRENDLWKIRENASDWRAVEGWAGPDEAKYQTGRYKTDEGAFAKGQMAVTSDDDQNIIVKEAGKYDVYYAMYNNDHPEGWYEVYVVEHGMRLSSLDVHAKLTDPATLSTIEVFEREGDIAVSEVEESIITASFSDLTNLITITPVAVGETTFKVSDGVKEFEVHVKVEAGSSAAETQFYIRGTAANGWGAVSEAYVLRESADPNNIGEILDVELKVGEFKIAKADWSEEVGWSYDDHSGVLGGAASKFSAGESDNNVKCNVAGYYNIYLTNNHYIAIESVGGDPVPTPMSSYYVRGTAVGSWDPLPANQMALDSGNKAIIEGIEMVVGEFKIANADWSESWGYKYKNDDEELDHITVIGGAAANFGEGESDGNIACKVAGTYNIYLTNNNYISFELATPTPPPTPEFALDASSGGIEIGQTFVVNALNLTGELHYSVTDGPATVVIDGAKATISSATAGVSTISFSDDSEGDPIVFTLTASEPAPITYRKQYIETKSWFNNNLDGEKVCVYAFKFGSNPLQKNADFPGLEATYVKDLEDGKKLFSYEIASTYDTFVVTRVVGEENSYQTVNIPIADLGTDNCIYLDAESGSNEIPFGHYDYVFKLDKSSATIAAGNSTKVLLEHTLGDVEYEVKDESDTKVTISGNIATITSNSVGDHTITFTNGEIEKEFNLTVEASYKQYIETKGWFNDGSAGQHVYVYAFVDDSDPMQENEGFPGEEATWIKDLEDGKKLFSYNVANKYDHIIISRVDDNDSEGTRKTADIKISSMTGNCICFTDSSLPAGNMAYDFYDYTFGLSSESGTITSGGSVTIDFVNFIGEVKSTVTQGTATVTPSEDGKHATISSTNIGENNIKFTDGTGTEKVYTLTVNEASTDVVYTVQNFDSWWITDGAHIYMWAYGGTTPGHWYEGVVDGSNMKFTLPPDCTTGIVVRVSGTIPDLSKWDGDTFSGMDKWNRCDGVSLSGSTSNILFDLSGGWHD